MVELRDYQQHLLEQVQASLSDSSTRVMLQLPTGGGKTHAAGALLLDWLQDGRKAVWLTHRHELATQTEKMLSDNGVSATCNISWTPDDLAPSITNGVVILMAQTVSRRTAIKEVWQRYDPNDLLVVDEAHHAAADGWARAIRQWPGPVLGMTATPWRLSEQEGFDHLFSSLICGPQVRELQTSSWLCPARVIAPPEEGQIIGGKVDGNTGDYTETGIERANYGRSDILTAGALRFWQEHGDNRQTVMYAVSIGHAKNLDKVFQDARIPTGLILGETTTADRDRLIEEFSNGNIKVLINVAVATEGFDLPDAACVMLTRPTMSLSLYLQMVGRGLRPKAGNGDCVVLDLAGNCQRHGLPEQKRKWSLAPRSHQDEEGGPLVVRCPDCEGLSPAASHYCVHCGASFGETCNRCGRWRAWETWSLMQKHDSQHDPVCDLCHYDAHIQAELPVTEEMKDLAKMTENIVLSPDRDPFLRNILEAERQRIYGLTDSRKEELRSLVESRKSLLNDSREIDRLFEAYLDELPVSDRPQFFSEKSDMYVSWREVFQNELTDWQAELEQLESHAVDIGLVYGSAKELLLRLFDAEAHDLGILPLSFGQQQETAVRTGEYLGNNPADTEGWLNFVQVSQWGQRLMQQSNKSAPNKPSRMRDPKGTETPLRNWASLLFETCDWLVRQGLLDNGACRVDMSPRGSRYLINDSPVHADGRPFKNIKRLSNGLYLESQLASGIIAQRCATLVEQFGQDPEQFHVYVR